VTGLVEPLGPLMQGLLEKPGLTVAGHLVHGQVKEAPDSSHQRGGEHAHQRDQGEVSSWRFCPSLNSTQTACFSRSASISTDAGILPGAENSTPARILPSA
jgi:hypothetical protein